MKDGLAMALGNSSVSPYSPPGEYRRHLHSSTITWLFHFRGLWVGLRHGMEACMHVHHMRALTDPGPGRPPATWSALELP
jgi:hypothetical protein